MRPSSRLVRPTEASMSQSMQQDMDDIYKMRTEGVSFAVFETRDSLIQMDDLILEAAESAGSMTVGKVTMNRITDHYWKRFGGEVRMWFQMFNFVMCSTRWEKVYTKDDPERNKKYGESGSVYAKAEVPFVIPYGSVQIELTTDEHFRDVITPVDEHGKPIKSIVVFYARRGGPKAKTQKFESECGALLEDWRRYNKSVKVYEDIVDRKAKPRPYLEHMAKSEQMRLEEGVQEIEEVTVYNPVNAESETFGKEKKKTEMKIVDSNNEEYAKSFIDVPENRRISGNQPVGELAFDMAEVHKRWMAQLTATLQVPARHTQQEEHRGLGSAGNDATVEDDMMRAARGASERRDEIVDVLSSMYERIYGARPGKVHLPTATHMKPPILFNLYERGMMDGQILVDEVAHALGIKKHQLKPPKKEEEGEKREEEGKITLEDVVRALKPEEKKKKKRKVSKE